jgi:hypothetical protein
MTTIITRLYPTGTAAHAVADALMEGGHQASYIDIIDHADPAAMRAARVSDVAANAYARAMTGGQALLVIRAPFSPIGAANSAKAIVGRYASVDAGLAKEDVYIREQAGTDLFQSILPDHPRFFSQDMDPGRGRTRTTVSSAFGMKLLVPYKNRRSVMAGSPHISTKFWPMKLVSANKTKHSVISGGGHPLSRLLGMAVISRRG